MRTAEEWAKEIEFRAKECRGDFYKQFSLSDEKGIEIVRAIFALAKERDELRDKVGYLEVIETAKDCSVKILTHENDQLREWKRRAVECLSKIAVCNPDWEVAALLKEATE